MGSLLPAWLQIMVLSSNCCWKTLCLVSLFDPIVVLNTLHEEVLWDMERLKTRALVLWIEQPPGAMFWPRRQFET